MQMCATHGEAVAEDAAPEGPPAAAAQARRLGLLSEENAGAKPAEGGAIGAAVGAALENPPTLLVDHRGIVAALAAGMLGVVLLLIDLKVVGPRFLAADDRFVLFIILFGGHGSICVQWRGGEG